MFAPKIFLSLFLAAVMLAASPLCADVTDKDGGAEMQAEISVTSFSTDTDEQKSFVSVPEPTTFFIGSMVLALGGGLLVRQKRPAQD